MKLVSYLAPLGAALCLGLAGCAGDDGSGSTSNGGTSSGTSGDPTSATMVTGDPTSATAMNTMSGSGTSVGPTTEPPTSTTDPDTGTSTEPPTTGTGSSGPTSSTGGSTVCDPANGDTECDTCIKESCCDELEACDMDGDENSGCQCLADCAGAATNPAELQACFGSCRVSFDDPLVMALLGCAGLSCGDTCVTPGGGAGG